MRKNTNKTYYDKYYQLWPYKEVCKSLHDFGFMMKYEEGLAKKCKTCGWLKYDIEFKAELEMNNKLDRIKKRAEIENSHISLFQF